MSGTPVRQVDTCDLLLRELPGSPEPVRDARFNEYDHASLLAFFEGQRLQELRRTGDRRGYFVAIRHALQQWTQYDGTIEGGESWDQFGARIQAGIADACAGLDRDDNVLIVSSGGVIGRYTAAALGASPETAIQLNLQIRNTGISEFVRTSSGEVRLVAFNSIPHLERADRVSAVTFA